MGKKSVESGTGPSRKRVLLLVENKQTRRLLEEWLCDAHEIVPLEAPDPLEERFDLVIIDGPALKGLRLRVRSKRKEAEPVFLPFLLLHQRRKGSVPTRHLGLVDDLILKPLDKVELRARVANLLRMRSLSLRLKREHDRAAKLAVTDDVSGFHNTRYLHRYLDRLMSSPKSRQRQVSLVFFDMDNFKEVVDLHGHVLGAKVLREVAGVVARTSGDEDRIVRYGGDEFVVILPGQGKEEALAKVEQIRDGINGTIYLEKEKLNIKVTASFGLATYPHDAADKKSLLVEADRCLFRSKGRGKNRISVKYE